MSELNIEQIILYRTLKLQPISRKEQKRWLAKIEQHEINNIKECYVKIENLVLPTQPLSPLVAPRKCPYNLRNRNN